MVCGLFLLLLSLLWSFRELVWSKWLETIDLFWLVLCYRTLHSIGFVSVLVVWWSIPKSISLTHYFAQLLLQLCQIRTHLVQFISSIPNFNTVSRVRLIWNFAISKIVWLTILRNTIRRWCYERLFLGELIYWLIFTNVWRQRWSLGVAWYLIW